jgi:2-C-methyl-D-erythritol 4-phosphate cytidylyltransferase
MPNKGSVTALIVAAGMGTRMNLGVPKQFLMLKGKPVVQWSLECFDQIAEIDRIILVLPQDWVDEGRDKLISFDPEKNFMIVAGGARRQDSVKAGIDAIREEDGWIIIHDGARPGISPDLVSSALEKARKLGNAVCAIPSNDTLVRVIDGAVIENLNRNEVFRIQTPQIFRLAKMRQALQNAIAKNITATDDAGLIRETGEKIFLVDGSELNTKVTRPEDLHIFEAIL